ncbi:hypothetical protein [Salipaludibacillus neizhouensis]|nr:hypothetical protein [Salipaludibacillus neizhouensis]
MVFLIILVKKSRYLNRIINSKFNKFYQLKMSNIIDPIYNILNVCKAKLFVLCEKFNNLLKSIVILFLTFTGVFWILYFVLPSNFNGINILGYFNFNYLILNSILTTVLTVLGVIISISITLLLFTYRQYSSFALSINNIVSRARMPILFFFITGQCIAYLALITFEFPTKINNTYIEQYYINNIARFDVAIILIVIVIFLTFRLFKNLILESNVISNVRSLSVQIDSQHKRIIFYNNKNMKKLMGVYENVRFSLEGFFQLLIILGKNNMDTELDKELKKWIGNRVSYILNDPIHPIFNKKQVLVHLLEVHSFVFVNYYKDILNQHMYLVLELYNKDKIDLANSVLAEYFNLLPSIDPKTESKEIRSELKQLRGDYFTSLDQLAVYLYQKKRYSLSYFLNEIIEKISLGRVKKKENNGYFSIVSTILQLAVENKDLKTTIDISHVLARKANTAIDEDEEVQTGFREKYNIKSAFKRIESKSVIESKKSSVLIMLQGLLKSIEISNHETVGFFIKFLSNNIEPKIIEPAINEFINHINNGIAIEYYDEFVREGTKLKYTFDYNQNTKEYCLKKMILLLYSQNMHIIENKINLNYEKAIAINTEPLRIDNRYLKHLINRIVSCSEYYALNCLDDRIFMDGIYRDLTYKNLVDLGKS